MLVSICMIKRAPSQHHGLAQRYKRSNQTAFDREGTHCRPWGRQAWRAVSWPRGSMAMDLHPPWTGVNYLLKELLRVGVSVHRCGGCNDNSNKDSNIIILRKYSNGVDINFDNPISNSGLGFLD